MKKNATFNELMLIIQDIEYWTVNSVTYGMFNRHRISEFRASNKAAIDKLNRYCSDLIERYAEKKEDGTAKLALINGTDQMTFRNEEDKAAFQLAYYSFLKLPLQLVV